MLSWIVMIIELGQNFRNLKHISTSAPIAQKLNHIKTNPIMYRVFIEYCDFFKKFQYFATSPSPALKAANGCCKENGQPLIVTVLTDLR